MDLATLKSTIQRVPLKSTTQEYHSRVSQSIYIYEIMYEITDSRSKGARPVECTHVEPQRAPLSSHSQLFYRRQGSIAELGNDRMWLLVVRGVVARTVG